MSSSRPNRPIRFPRGDSYVHEVRLVDDDGDAIDISSDRTYAAQIRRKPDDTSTIATFSCSITSGSGGKVTMSLSAETTAAITPGNYVYDLVETNTAAGTSLTLMRGTVTVEHDVTR
jgi:hypothetical protein